MEGGGGGDEAVVVAADKVLLMLLMLMLMLERLVLKLMEGRGRRGESLQAGADGMLLECLVLLLRPQQVRRYLVVLHQGERRGRRGRRLLVLMLQGGRPRRWSRPRGHYADHLRLVVPANARAWRNHGTVAGKVDRRCGHCGRPPLGAASRAAAGSSQLLDPLDPQEKSFLVPQLEDSDVLQVFHRYAAYGLLQGSVSLLVEERPVLRQPQQVQPLLQGSLPIKSNNES